MLTKKDKNVATANAIRSEAQSGIRSLALPVAPGENVKAQWRKIARKTGLTARRVRTLWYGQANTIHGHELDLIRALNAAERRIDRAQETAKDLRAEIADLCARFDRLIELIGSRQNG